MTESQNPTVPAAMRRRYSGLWGEKPKISVDIYHCISAIAAMAPLFDTLHDDNIKMFYTSINPSNRARALIKHIVKERR